MKVNRSSGRSLRSSPGARSASHARVLSDRVAPSSPPVSSPRSRSRNLENTAPVRVRPGSRNRCEPEQRTDPRQCRNRVAPRCSIELQVKAIASRHPRQPARNTPLVTGAHRRCARRRSWQLVSSRLQPVSGTHRLLRGVRQDSSSSHPVSRATSFASSNVNSNVPSWARVIHTFVSIEESDRGYRRPFQE